MWIFPIVRLEYFSRIYLPSNDWQFLESSIDWDEAAGHNHLWLDKKNKTFFWNTVNSVKIKYPANPSHEKYRSNCHFTPYFRSFILHHFNFICLN